MTAANFLEAVPLVLTLGFSVAYCFFGYRFLRIQLTAAGAIVGLNVAFMLSFQLFPRNFSAAFIFSLVGATVGALCFTFMYRAGIFCIGAIAGMLVAPVVLRALSPPLPEFVSMLLYFLAASIGGTAAYALHRQFMIGFTAIVGGFSTVISLHLLVYRRFEAQPRDVQASYHEVVSQYWMIIAILIAAGVVYQLRAKQMEEKH